MLFIITISTFVCISLGLLGIYWLLYRPQSAATERLKRLGATTATGAPSPSLTSDVRLSTELAERIASPLKRMLLSRQQRVRWGLADALDLMVISIEAGLGLNAAMMKVASELKDVHPDISEEFELANLEIRVGREREEALRNLAERTGVKDLHSLVAMLIQTDRFGTSIARAIRVFSDSLRTKRRQRAEQAAQKAAVKLLFPLACFLFPTLFIAILGPAVLTLMDTLGKM